MLFYRKYLFLSIDTRSSSTYLCAYPENTKLQLKDNFCARGLRPKGQMDWLTYSPDILFQKYNSSTLKTFHNSNRSSPPFGLVKLA